MVYTDKGNFSASKVFSSLFDPKSLISQTKYPVLKQHFIGWFIKAPKGSFDPDKILFMDFNIPQSKQTRFLRPNLSNTFESQTFALYGPSQLQ